MADVFDVVIIGGGPVGMCLALDLGLHGIRCAIFDERVDLTDAMPKCNTINARSLELLRKSCLPDRIRGVGMSRDISQDVVYLTRWNGMEICRFRHRTSHETTQSAFVGSVEERWKTPEKPHRVSQIYLEPLFREALKKIPCCHVFEGWTFQGDIQDDGKIVTSSFTCSNGSKTVTSRYVVGCDGSKSLVRKAIGAKLEGISEITTFRSVYFRSKAMKLSSRISPAWMYRIRKGENFVMIIKISEEQDLWLVHDDVGNNHGSVQVESPKQLVEAALGCSLQDFALIKEEVWTARSMVVNKFFSGNIALCGDAAHIWIPMGGFGMNAGIEDAFNLSWKLRAMCKGWGGPLLLSSYEIERKTAGELIRLEAAKMYVAVVGKFDGLENGLLESESSESALLRERAKKVFDDATSWEFKSEGLNLGITYPSSPVVAFSRHLFPSSSFKVDSYSESFDPGSRLPHLWISQDFCIYDLLGDGLTLFFENTSTGHLLREMFTQVSGQEGIPLCAFPMEKSYLIRKRAVLVRPDQVICWSENDLISRTQIQDVLRKVTGNLSFQKL